MTYGGATCKYGGSVAEGEGVWAVAQREGVQHAESEMKVEVGVRLDVGSRLLL